MDETYRMLGREHRADLEREARKRSLAVEAGRPRQHTKPRWFVRLERVAIALNVRRMLRRSARRATA